MYQNTSNLSPKIRTGRPKKLNDRDQRCIIRDCLTNPSNTSQDLANNFNSFNKDRAITSSTVQKLLFKFGLRSYSAPNKPFLSFAMKKKRLAWCKKYQNKEPGFWHNVIFSDETYIHINMNKAMNRIRRFSHKDIIGQGNVNRTI